MCCILHKKRHCTVIILNESFIHKTGFWAEGSEGEGTCHQAQKSEFNPQTHRVGEMQLLQGVISSSHMCCDICAHTCGQAGTYACMNTHSCVNKKVKLF